MYLEIYPQRKSDFRTDCEQCFRDAYSRLKWLVNNRHEISIFR